MLQSTKLVLLGGCGLCACSGGRDSATTGLINDEEPSAVVTNDHKFVTELHGMHGGVFETEDMWFAVLQELPDAQAPCSPATRVGNRYQGLYFEGVVAVGSIGTFPTTDDSSPVAWHPVLFGTDNEHLKGLFNGTFTVAVLQPREVVVEVQGADVCDLKPGVNDTDSAWFALVDGCVVADLTLSWYPNADQPDFDISGVQSEVAAPGAYHDASGNPLCGSI